MYDLFVGDVGEYLAHAALQHNPSARLLTTDTPSTGTYYTSIADVGSLENFISVCKNASRIYYCPPETWSGCDNQRWTEELLAYIKQRVIVHGQFDLPKQYLQDDLLHDDRKIAGPQMWAVGCSITVGVGVNVDQTWKHHVQQHLNMAMSELNASGSSIIWQSDQIVRSDIRAGDVVFWGLTSHHRMPIIVDKQLIHLNTKSFDQAPELLKVVNPDMLDNDTLLYHNVMAIRRAKNFCNKAGAELITMGLMHDFETVYAHYGIHNFEQLITWPEQYVDLGTDNHHPGPQQHQLFAEKFIERYEDSGIS